MAGLNVQVVVYKTSPDIVVALFRNDVQMMIDFPPAVQGQVNDGKVRLLASSSPKRSALLPNMPTVEEAGVKGYEVISWNGVAAPKGTPQEVIDTMNKAMHEVLAIARTQGAIRQGRRGSACLHAGRADGPAHCRHQEMGRGHRQGRDPEEVAVLRRLAPARLLHGRAEFHCLENYHPAFEIGEALRRAPVKPRFCAGTDFAALIASWWLGFRLSRCEAAGPRAAARDKTQPGCTAG